MLVNFSINEEKRVKAVEEEELHIICEKRGRGKCEYRWIEEKRRKRF